MRTHKKSSIRLSCPRQFRPFPHRSIRTRQFAKFQTIGQNTISFDNDKNSIVSEPFAGVLFAAQQHNTISDEGSTRFSLHSIVLYKTYQMSIHGEMLLWIGDYHAQDFLSSSPVSSSCCVRISYNVDVVRSSIAMYLSIFYHASNIANIHIKQYCIGNRIYEQSNDF